MEGDAACVHAHDLAREAQPDAGALPAGGVKGDEDLVLLLKSLHPGKNNVKINA